MCQANVYEKESISDRKCSVLLIRYDRPTDPVCFFHLQNDLYSKVLMSEPNMHSDFSRLARWLTGNSVGLVLGGGGARGAAHVGMLKSIQEAGIPIDMVGGVSIGAFMGALWCSDRNIASVTQKAREWSKVNLIECVASINPRSNHFRCELTENDAMASPNLRPNVSNYVHVLWSWFQ